MQNSHTGLNDQGSPRTCGFRFSRMDAVILIVGFLGWMASWHFLGNVSLFIPFVVGHFFLFCNLFRIRRKPELIWTALFLLQCAIWIILGRFEVYRIGIVQIILTMVILLNELRNPRYHGIFSRKINPRIDDYLSGGI